MWHCPQCGAPQAESARCWVCHRSSTTCSTCRQFQLSLTSEVGWCGLDPRRRPLTGVEQRGCWQERPATSVVATNALERPGQRTLPADDGEPVSTAHLDFVPIELAVRTVAPVDRSHASGSPATVHFEPTVPPVVAAPDESWARRTSLFGEPDA
jgi:hypothetical protein